MSENPRVPGDRRRGWEGQGGGGFRTLVGFPFGFLARGFLGGQFTLEFLGLLFPDSNGFCGF